MVQMPRELLTDAVIWWKARLPPRKGPSLQCESNGNVLDFEVCVQLYFVIGCTALDVEAFDCDTHRRAPFCFHHRCVKRVLPRKRESG